MNTSIEEFERWLKKPEGLNLEFKEAKNQFDRQRSLPDYCAALANERGGKLILGVDSLGHVVGTKAFLGTHNKLSHELLNELKIRIDVEELIHPKGRVLIFHVLSRQVGSVIRSTGSYNIPMRAGESITEMDDQTLRSIMNENSPDFSMQPLSGSSIHDVDEEAVHILRSLCFEKTKNQNYKNCSLPQLLTDLGLYINSQLNSACILLIGKAEALRQYLPQAEIIWEWRQLSGKIPYDFRKTWRMPFLKVFDDIWTEIDKKNLRTPYKQGFIQKEIFAFDKDSIREAILNAVAHRDYTLHGQVVFVTASPDEFVIESPGGFLPGITPENAIRQRAWRNQRLAETLEKTGLIERSGQGLDLIYQRTIQDGKGTPNFNGSDSHCVRLHIPALVKDKDFVLYLEQIINEKQISLSFDEILELENIREKQMVTRPDFKDKFLDLGIIEQVGKTKGAKYLLSYKYYEHIGKAGKHTRLADLSRDKNKELILTHLRKNKNGLIHNIMDALGKNRTYVGNLLQELKKEGKIAHTGNKRSGYWSLK